MNQRRFLCLVLVMVSLVFAGCGHAGLDNTFKPVPEGVYTKPIMSPPPSSGPTIIKPGSVVASYFDGIVKDFVEAGGEYMLEYTVG